MADPKKQQLVLAFVDFLNESILDGTVKDDDKEGLDIASASPFLSLTARRFTPASPVHRRGLWRRSIRRCPAQATQHQARKAAHHIRRLPQDERQGRIVLRPIHVCTAQDPLRRGQEEGREAQAVRKHPNVRQKARFGNRLVLQGDRPRPHQCRLFLQPRRRPL